jgi:hypothetical protein
MSASNDPKAEMEAARAEVTQAEKEIKAIKTALNMVMGTSGTEGDSAAKVSTFKVSALKVGYMQLKET